MSCRYCSGKLQKRLFVMVFVVTAYIGIEFINKYRTDRTMTQLRRLTSPTAQVIRNGERQVVATGDIVCGDVLVLAEGSRIPLMLG